MALAPRGTRRSPSRHVCTMWRMRAGHLGPLRGRAALPDVRACGRRRARRPVTGGVGPRRKGYRLEAKVRAMATDAGAECVHVPLSGAAPGWAGDLMLSGRRFEVRARTSGFRQLYGWLGPHFGLV